MSCIYLTSDLHIGHENIGKFRKNVDSPGENEAWLADYWDNTVRKRDIVWIMGDACFTEEGLDWYAARPGKKYLVAGNHDDLHMSKYLEVFEDVRGFVKKWGFWLSHAPIHPQELRGRQNIHGHLHYQTIDDPRYINVCCDHLFETTGKPFITLQEVRKYFGRIDNEQKTEDETM